MRPCVPGRVRRMARVFDNPGHGVRKVSAPGMCVCRFDPFRRRNTRDVVSTPSTEPRARAPHASRYVTRHPSTVALSTLAQPPLTRWSPSPRWRASTDGPGQPPACGGCRATPPGWLARRADRCRWRPWPARPMRTRSRASASPWCSAARPAMPGAWPRQLAVKGEAEAAGLGVRLLRADAYPTAGTQGRALACCIVVISTQGDGDPPDDARALRRTPADGKRAPEAARPEIRGAGPGRLELSAVQRHRPAASTRGSEQLGAQRLGSPAAKPTWMSKPWPAPWADPGHWTRSQGGS